MAGEKVIIVDDEVDILDLCKRVLESKGFQVTTAQNGIEAIALAQREQFDLLLTDIKMPGVSGLDLVQAIRNSNSDITCVIMSGHSTVDDVVEALKLSVDEFIIKPFSPEVLIQLVTKALEKEKLRKENYRLRSLIPLFELNKTLMGTVRVEEVLNSLYEIIIKEIEADLTQLYTVEEETELICGHIDNGQNKVKRQALDQLVQLVLDRDRQLVLDLKRVSNNRERTILNNLGVQAVSAIPLKSQNTTLGALILARHEEVFTPSENEFLRVLTSQASIALENALLFTKIQDAYEELQTLDHMKSEFVNIAAHELRTPLAILLGYATVLEEDTAGSQHDYVVNIIRNALRLRSLIDDMLNLQYLESGMLSLANDELDLQEIIQDLIQDLSLIASGKNLDIKTEIPDDFPQIIADRHKFDLIVVNLLHNAIKFTPQGGQITLRATVDGEQAVLSVNNTGSFIPEEEYGRIFERFYQVEHSLTREHQGIGLGLAIVRGMVQASGGEISVQSDENKGTTFTFTLPLDNSHLERYTPKLT